MSRDEQLELLDELWALVRDDRLSVPDSHIEELERRAEAAERDGVVGDDWATVRERLRRSLPNGIEPGTAQPWRRFVPSPLQNSRERPLSWDGVHP